MPKNQKSLLVTKQSETLDDVSKLITTTAKQHFLLMKKKASPKLFLQMTLLKRYSFNYFVEISDDKEASAAIKKNPKLAKALINNSEIFHQYLTTEAFGSKSENQARFQAVRDKRLNGVSTDKFNGFKRTVNKYNPFNTLNLSIAHLDNEEIALDTTKRIFVLFNQVLPYYSQEIRGCFDLEQLFIEFEKNRQNFFKKLKILLSKEPLPKNPEFYLLKQVQVYGLCAAMMWINQSKLSNDDFDLAIFSVLDMLSTLLPNRLKDLMFTDYPLGEADRMALLPSPLNMIGVLIEHYQNEKNENLLSSLQTIKQCFMDMLQRNFLQDSLKQEFIFFLDRLLDFVLTKNETAYRANILDYYDRLLPLIEELMRLFEYDSQTEELHLLNHIKTNWDNFINETNLTDQVSILKGSQLINEREKIKAQLQQKQHAQAEAFQEKTIEKAAKRLAEKKEKALQEEAIATLKMQERLAELQMSPIDQLQSELQLKMDLQLLGPNLSTDEKFNIKKKITIEEIAKCLKVDPLEKMNENALVILKEGILASGDELSSNERHTLLIHSISLADNYLSRVNNRITYFKENYAPCLKKMTERHRQGHFGQSDHKTYRKIKDFMQPALENLLLTGDYCECLLTIFEMIICLKGKIENKEFYRLWNSAIMFRKEEHRDLYKSFLENLQQLKTYRESKKIAFKTLVPSAYQKSKRNNSVKVDGKMITKALENLMTAIEKITEILAMNDEEKGYIANVSMVKEDHLRAAQLQTAVIDENKIRKPIKHHPHELFRRSRSFHKSGITENNNENDRTEEVNCSRSRRMSC